MIQIRFTPSSDLLQFHAAVKVFLVAWLVPGVGRTLAGRFRDACSAARKRCQPTVVTYSYCKYTGKQTLNCEFCVQLLSADHTQFHMWKS